MTSATIPISSDDRLPEPTSVHDVSWWAMCLVCATEASFFVYCIASYFYLGAANPVWPPVGIAKPSLQKPIAMTIILVCSSATLYWGERGIKQGNQHRFKLGLAASIVLGIVFLGFQWSEYHEKLQHFLPETNAYASIFYTTTGFHGAHVAFGVLMLLFIGVRALLGHFDAEHHVAVTTASLYWHFVDVVWLVIFTSFYLSPHFY
jgi:heme/copper-type cytochrome/quinol oxidase subunit 3